jgi:hypothetical protein
VASQLWMCWVLFRATPDTLCELGHGGYGFAHERIRSHMEASRLHALCAPQRSNGPFPSLLHAFRALSERSLTPFEVCAVSTGRAATCSAPRRASSASWPRRCERRIEVDPAALRL